MTRSHLNNYDGFLSQLVWWIVTLICVVYGIYALYMAGVEISSLLGIAENAPLRAAPFMFVVHASSGSAALISGPLQFNRRILAKKRKLHRTIGRIYVGAIWISSIGGLWNAIFFDVTIAAKIAFSVLSILWCSTTTIAFLRIRDRKIGEHREWMIRSFSLSFFFVTFSFWVPGLASTNLPTAVSYPLAVFLSWSLNLLAAEVWIRHTRLQFTALRHI